MALLKDIVLAALLPIALSIGGCASKRSPRPVADTVCVVTAGLSDTEAQYVHRRAVQYLADYSMRVVPAACDVSVAFIRLSSTAATATAPSLPFFSTGTLFGTDGTLSITRGEERLRENDAINLRRYASANDVLDALAWAMVGPVTKAYRASTEPL